MNAPPDAKGDVADAAPPRKKLGLRCRKLATNTACLVLGFLLVQWAFDHIDSPFQAAEQKVGNKFAYFASHKDAYDVVFIGSSRVLNQLSPHTFDAQMKAAGYPCRSFNFGYVGMYLPECSFLLDRILALHPAKLRLVVMELSNPAPRAAEIGSLTERQAYWHHSGPTALASAAILAHPPTPENPVGRGPQIFWQLKLLLRCLCHVGDGPDAVLSLFRRGRHAKIDAGKAVLGADRNGFIPLTTHLGGGAPGATTRDGGDQQDLATFVAATATLRDRDEPETGSATIAKQDEWTRLGDQVLRRSLRQRVQTLERAGITPVFFIAPGLTREKTFVRLHVDGTLPFLAAFNDPAEYPELYDPEVRADRYHLNAQGADLLTCKLAAEICRQEPARGER